MSSGTMTESSAVSSKLRIELFKRKLILSGEPAASENLLHSIKPLLPRWTIREDISLFSTASLT